MSFPLNAAKLRKLTDLRPKLQNDTRSSSISLMLQRYIQVHEIIKQIELLEVQELRLCDDGHVEVKRLFRLLDDLPSVTKELQSEDIGLCLARVLFDGVVEKHKQADSRLGPSSSGLSIAEILGCQQGRWAGRERLEGDVSVVAHERRRSYYRSHARPD